MNGLSQEEYLSSEANFPAILREAIKKGLSHVLGESGARATLYHMSMSESDLEDPVKFHRKLTEIFAAGTPALEKILIMELDESLRLPLRAVHDSGFVTSVLDAKRIFMARESRRRTR